MTVIVEVPAPHGGTARVNLTQLALVLQAKRMQEREAA